MAILVKRGGAWVGGTDSLVRVKSGGTFGSRIKKAYVKRNGYWVDSGYFPKPFPAYNLHFAAEYDATVYVIANAAAPPDWELFRVFVSRDSEGVVWTGDYGTNYWYEPEAQIGRPYYASGGLQFNLDDFGGPYHSYFWHIQMYRGGVWSDPTATIWHPYYGPYVPGNGS